MARTATAMTTSEEAESGGLISRGGDAPKPEKVLRLYADLRAVQSRIDATKDHLRNDLQVKRKEIYEALLEAGEQRVDVAKSIGMTSQAVANAINGRPGRE